MRHGSCKFLLGLIEVHPHIMKYQLATTSRTWDSILDKNLNLDNLAKSEVSGSWNIGHEVMALVYSCWFYKRYILIWNINLLPLIGLEILPWTKMLIWSTDGRMYSHMHDNLNALWSRPWGHKKKQQNPQKSEFLSHMSTSFLKGSFNVTR